MPSNRVKSAKSEIIKKVDFEGHMISYRSMTDCMCVCGGDSHISLIWNRFNLGACKANYEHTTQQYTQVA